MDQVSYFSFEGAPGQYFRCERYGTMNTQRCASNYEAAPAASREGRLSGCIRCPIGAMHSGGTLAVSAPRAAGWCARCRRAPEEYSGGGVSRVRLVNGGICVSCANRQYEVAKGVNAKGVTPKKWAALGPRFTGLLKDDGVSTTRQPMARDQLEVTLIALRRDSRAMGCWVSPGVLPAPVLDLALLDERTGQFVLFDLAAKSPRRPRAKTRKSPTILADQLVLFEDL
jgi:hypothetical protein